MPADELTWTCSSCEKIHRGLPALAFSAPAPYYGIPEYERGVRAILTPDTCIIDAETFFVRCVLRVPVAGTREGLEWGVWSSLSEANFKRYQETFDDLDQSKLGTMPSWFSSQLPGYPSTLNLRSRIRPSDNGKRPTVELDPAQDHPLVADLRDGLSVERAIAFAEHCLHRH